MPPKSPKQRDDERRETKLAEMAEQVADGRLTIRKMTPAEREKYGSRAKGATPRRPRRRAGP